MKAAEFIRQNIEKSPSEIMALAKKQGVKINNIKRIYSVRAREKKQGKLPAPPAKRGRRPGWPENIKAEKPAKAKPVRAKRVARVKEASTSELESLNLELLHLVEAFVTIVSDRVLERIRTAL